MRRDARRIGDVQGFFELALQDHRLRQRKQNLLGVVTERQRFRQLDLRAAPPLHPPGRQGRADNAPRRVRLLLEGVLASSMIAAARVSSAADNSGTWRSGSGDRLTGCSPRSLPAAARRTSTGRQEWPSSLDQSLRWQAAASGGDRSAADAQPVPATRSVRRSGDIDILIEAAYGPGSGYEVGYYAPAAGRNSAPMTARIIDGKARALRLTRRNQSHGRCPRGGRNARRQGLPWCWSATTPRRTSTSATSGARPRRSACVHSRMTSRRTRRRKTS